MGSMGKLRLVWTVVTDLFGDGYKLVSITAPFLSLAFTITKIFEVPIMGFREVSYAWASLPLLIWVFIAYVRRWLKSKSLELERDNLQDLKNYEGALDELSRKFDYGNNEIFNSSISNENEYPIWKEKWKSWYLEVECYLEEHFGLRERNMFKNLVIVHTPEFGGVNKDHAFDRRLVAQQLETIRATIIRHSDRVQRWREESISALKKLAK